MPDVKLIKPERLTDNPDGGGLATGIEIVDNEINNLFPDVSRIDRVNGDTSLRKIFLQADTPDTETFLGAHLIIKAPPQDPRLAAVLFRTRSWSDERDVARIQVERYLDESVIMRLIPYDKQLAGQRLVNTFQRPEFGLPEIGEVVVLEDRVTGDLEFIRVQNVDHELQTISDDSGDYVIRVITLTITQPLSREFPGTQPNRFFRVDNTGSFVRRAVASDAARYYATVPLAQDANPGDLRIKLGTVFTQLVPATTSESAVTDVSPAGATVVAAAGPAITLVQSLVGVSGNTQWFALGVGMKPRSVTFKVTNGASVSTWTDNGDGTFAAASGNPIGGTLEVDYAQGRVRYDGVPGSTAVFNVTFTPAATLSRSPLSFQTPIKNNTRGYVYLATLRPIPAPGTSTVSYRALGRWYEFVDDGTGQLVGEPGTGGGQINYTTGSVSVSLGALPDIGSSVIFAWGGDSELEVRTADGAILPPRVELTLANDISFGTVSLSWLAGGIVKTATSNGSGAITGDGSGYIDATLRKVVFRPTLIPDSNSTVTAEYGAHDMPYSTEVFSPTPAAGFATVTLADPPKPGTLHIAVQYTPPGGGAGFGYLYRDNGAGAFRATDVLGAELPGPPEMAGITVDYATGELVVPTSVTRTVGAAVYTQLTDALPQRTEDADTGYYSAAAVPTKKATGYTPTAGAWTFDGNVGVTYLPDAAGAGPDYVEEFDMPPLRIDLTPNVTNAIVPGGVLLSFGGRNYFDRGGVLYYGIAPSTLAATVGGTINHTTGVVTLTSYPGGVAPAFSLKALLTEVRPLPLSVLHARTPGSPLRPGSFYIQANRIADGALITAIADAQGKIDTADMHGYIDVTNGVFSIAFGGYVLDASLTSDDKAEAWYSASNVDGSGYIFRPREVVPGSVRFSCVVQTSLPLDPEIIGVNPVRLPLDGRVQSIRQGNTLVIHDTQVTTFPNPVAADDVVVLGRTDLASVVVYDQLGVAVATTKFAVDLVAGTVTMASPLDLSGYTQPLVALHTIEDMALCTDAQITGDVALAQPLTRGYSAANSLCSSALILGDLQARIEHLYAQNTWTNVWSNALIGVSPVSGAQYNDLTYPLVVTNRSAITQRWRLQFTSSTAFQIVAEDLGVVGTGTTASNVAPMNPYTGEPYFTLNKDGFGTGWATGNVIRFNTIAGGAPLWVARITKAGPATNLDDRIVLEPRWDKD